MRVELLNSRVDVYARVITDPDAKHVRDRFRQITLGIDQHGHVEAGQGRYRFPDDRPVWEAEQETIELLIEEGLLESRRIGPEDSELFLTAEGERHFSAQLQVLGGWHEWPVDSSTTPAG